jgi:metal-responsive CopG/Arc/MetJ family transcriptional regulator
VRITLSIPDQIVKRFYSMVPSRRRSRIIAGLIEKEIKQREALLENACLAANADEMLQRDIEDWQSFEDPLSE